MIPIASTAAADYARAVRAALADLPSEQAHAIVDGLDEHLAEIAADGTAELAQTLGPPDAYAAELRSAAGLPPVAESKSATSEATSADEAVEVSRAPVPVEVKDRRALGARIAIGLVLAVLAVVVIRASDPLNGLEIVIGAAAVGVAWLGLRWLAERADLPEAWTARLPWALGTAAALAAVLVGGQLAGSNSEVVYIDNAPKTTTLPGMEGSNELAAVPDLVGLRVTDAENLLLTSGFVVEIVAAEDPNADMLDRFVAWADPSPGSIVPVGSLVRLGVTSAGLSGAPFPGPTTTLVEVETEVTPTSTLTASATTLVPVTTVDAPTTSPSTTIEPATTGPVVASTTP